MVVGLVPGVAQAHEWGVPGVGGAQLFMPVDGYAPGPLFSFVNRDVVVQGRGFDTSFGIAQVFECIAGATDPLATCQPLGTAPVDAGGGVQTTVNLNYPWLQPGGTTVNCKGGAPTFAQCSVVAATYNPTTLSASPTSMAEHYVCFNTQSFCNPKPTEPTTSTTTTSTSTTTTTTTTIPPTTTTTTTVPPPAECTLREVAVVHTYTWSGLESGGNGVSQVPRPQVWQKETPRQARRPERGRPWPMTR